MGRSNRDMSELVPAQQSPRDGSSMIQGHQFCTNALSRIQVRLQQARMGILLWPLKRHQRLLSLCNEIRQKLCQEFAGIAAGGFPHTTSTVDWTAMPVAGNAAAACYPLDVVDGFKVTIGRLQSQLVIYLIWPLFVVASDTALAINKARQPCSIGGAQCLHSVHGS